MIRAGRYTERLAAARRALAGRGLAGLLVAVGPDLEYLTGYRARPSERLTMLVLPHDREAVLVVPRLERGVAEAGLHAELPTATWADAEDPYELVFRGLGGGTVAVSDALWASHLLRLQDRRPEVTFVPASTVLRELRSVKDADEIELLTRAAHAADRVVAHIAGGQLVGRIEADVAREVRDRLVSEGHDAASFAIVASGPNSASPHHEPADRAIEPGEPVVLDIGGTLGGYGSDITRTLWVTGADPSRGPDEEYVRLFDAVRRAQAEATSAARPGVAASRVDSVARDIITAAGYGEQFIHRLGHGIGLEGHEDPYLVAGNDEPLREGQVFSIEPGVYVEGRYGARIEDIVVCASDGAIVLNEASRDLYVVAG